MKAKHFMLLTALLLVTSALPLSLQAKDIK